MVEAGRTLWLESSQSTHSLGRCPWRVMIVHTGIEMQGSKHVSDALSSERLCEDSTGSRLSMLPRDVRQCHTHCRLASPPASTAF